MGRIPLLQVLVRAAEIVQGHDLLALQAGLVLGVKRAFVQVRRLGVIAHAVVDDGDTVERGQSVLRQLLLVEQRLGAPELVQARGVLAAQSAQIAAREQHFGKHPIIAGLRGNGDGLVVQDARLRVVADRLQRFALAIEYPGAQTRACGLRQQRRRRRDLLLGSGSIALRVVVAQ